MSFITAEKRGKFMMLRGDKCLFLFLLYLYVFLPHSFYFLYSKITAPFAGEFCNFCFCQSDRSKDIEKTARSKFASLLVYKTVF